MQRRRLLAMGLLSLMVLLAGCSALSGGSGPSISDPTVEVVDAGPAVIFNYSVSDYADAMLQAPNGEVINEITLEPNKTIDGMYLGTPESGTYKIIVRRGGETVAEKSVTYDGADPSITSIQANWSGNTLHGVNATIQNSGDLPVRISSANVDARGSSIGTGTLYRWIEPNESKPITVSPQFGELTVTEPGEVRGSITINTSSGILTEEFHQTFEGSRLEIVNQTANWDGASLSSVTVQVENTGDLPTTANAEIHHGEEILVDSRDEHIPSGATTTFKLSGYSSIYEVESGGKVQLPLIINSSSGFVRADITKEIEGASLSIGSFTPNWQNGQLKSVSMTLTNSGGLEADTTTKLLVNGEELLSSSRSVNAGKSVTVDFDSGDYSWSKPLYSATSAGDVQVTISVSSGGQSLSETEIRQFSGPDITLNNVDATFYEQIDSNNLEFSGLDFDIRNTGDVILAYDSVQVLYNGASRTDSSVVTTSIKPGGSSWESPYFSDSYIMSPGDHEITIRLLRSGEPVASETITVTAEA